MILARNVGLENDLCRSLSRTAALCIPAEGSDPRLVSINITPGPHNDGNADSYDNVPDLSPRLGEAFKQRRVSDFYIKDIEDSSPQFSGFIRHDDVALHGKSILCYTTVPFLPIDKCCTKYIGFDPPEHPTFLER